MAEAKLTKKEIKKLVDDEGYVHINVLFEIIGSPKNHVKDAMHLFLKNIAGDTNIKLLSEDLEEIIELEGGMFSIAAEVEYLVLGIEKLTWLAFNFMPASIEIKAPAELTFNDKDLSAWLNDLLAKLHEVNTIHTGLKSQYDAMVKNVNALVRNVVLLAVGEGQLTSKEIASKAGMSDKAILPFLEALIKEGKIVHDGKKYSKK